MDNISVIMRFQSIIRKKIRMLAQEYLEMINPFATTDAYMRQHFHCLQ